MPAENYHFIVSESSALCIIAFIMRKVLIQCHRFVSTLFC